MHQRRFNLVPLCELYPDFIHPILSKKMSDLLDECMDPDEPSVYIKKQNLTKCIL
jgi:2-amino-4-hydroxy-6-hydroxymethyldihydropteridine diphosphokinase